MLKDSFERASTAGGVWGQGSWAGVLWVESSLAPVSQLRVIGPRRWKTLRLWIELETGPTKLDVVTQGLLQDHRMIAPNWHVYCVSQESRHLTSVTQPCGGDVVLLWPNWRFHSWGLKQQWHNKFNSCPFFQTVPFALSERNVTTDGFSFNVFSYRYLIKRNNS